MSWGQELYDHVLLTDWPTTSVLCLITFSTLQSMKQCSVHSYSSLCSPLESHNHLKLQTWMKVCVSELSTFWSIKSFSVFNFISTTILLVIREFHNQWQKSFSSSKYNENFSIYDYIYTAQTLSQCFVNFSTASLVLRFFFRSFYINLGWNWKQYNGC